MSIFKRVSSKVRRAIAGDARAEKFAEIRYLLMLDDPSLYKQLAVLYKQIGRPVDCIETDRQGLLDYLALKRLVGDDVTPDVVSKIAAYEARNYELLNLPAPKNKEQDRER